MRFRTELSLCANVAAGGKLGRRRSVSHLCQLQFSQLFAVGAAHSALQHTRATTAPVYLEEVPFTVVAVDVHDEACQPQMLRVPVTQLSGRVVVDQIFSRFCAGTSPRCGGWPRS